MATKWIVKALEELGVRETPGTGHNPRVVEYHQATGLRADNDETPWCGSFVAWVLLQCGIPYNFAMAASARSWLDYGKVLDEPIPGCIVISAGHVTFFVDWANEEHTRFKGLGGNQSGGMEVSIAEFPVKDVLGYRWPEDQPIPTANQPLAKSSVIRWAGAAGAATIGVLIDSTSEIVQSLDQADQQSKGGSIFALIATLVILGSLAGVIISRIKGKVDEMQIQSGNSG